MKFRSFLAGAVAAAFAFNLSAPLALAGNVSAASDPDANYDRLDGTGTSGKKVDVIEWEGNLEIHVYPKGSVAGLGLKLDKRNKDRPVMVIAYRFVESPQQQLVRRNILGIPMYDGFKVYKDPMESEFDKFIISNNGLSGDLTAFKLDPPPTQLYPEGSPMLANGSGQDNSGRSPASATQGTDSSVTPAAPKIDSAGTIQPFFMDGGPRGR